MFPQQPAADYTVTRFDQSILDEANTLLSSMSLEQKVGQMFLARCPETDAAGQAAAYYLGGYLLFGRDFENKTSDQVIADIQSYQDANTTPMFIAVDEEGGYCQQSQHKLTASSLSFLVSPGIVRRGRTGSGALGCRG